MAKLHCLDENTSRQPADARHVLEFQTRRAFRFPEGVHGAAGLADGGGHAAAGMGTQAGGPERDAAQGRRSALGGLRDDRRDDCAEGFRARNRRAVRGVEKNRHRRRAAVHHRPRSVSGNPALRSGRGRGSDAAGRGRHAERPVAARLSRHEPAGHHPDARRRAGTSSISGITSRCPCNSRAAARSIANFATSSS